MNGEESLFLLHIIQCTTCWNRHSAFNPSRAVGSRCTALGDHSRSKPAPWSGALTDRRINLMYMFWWKGEPRVPGGNPHLNFTLKKKLIIVVNKDATASMYWCKKDFTSLFILCTPGDLFHKQTAMQMCPRKHGCHGAVRQYFDGEVEVKP